MNNREFPRLLIACVLAIGMAAVCAHAADLPEKGISAHRGASSTHPENTLAAIAEAIRLGAHQLEIDVVVTKDGQLVLMHDSKLTRTTDAKKVFPGRKDYKVTSFTLDELKQLDAGRWKGLKFAGEKIPTLEEALAIVPANMWVNLDIKSGEAKHGKIIAEEVLRLGVEKQSFMSVRGEAPNGVREVMAETGKTILLNNMERQDNTTRYIEETIQGKFDFIQLRGDPFPAAEDMRKLKEAGVVINYCCSDNPQQIRTWLENGADFVLVNDVTLGMKVARFLDIERLPALAEPVSFLMSMGLGLLLIRRMRPAV